VYLPPLLRTAANVALILCATSGVTGRRSRVRRDESIYERGVNSLKPRELWVPSIGRASLLASLA
jgi:hypothetical protein